MRTRSTLAGFGLVFRAGVAAFVVLHVGERLALLGLAFSIVGGASPAKSIASGAMLAALAAARGFLRGSLYVQAQSRLHAQTIDALVAGDLLRPNALESDDAEGAVIEGVISGARLVAELTPQLIADAAASVLITLFFIAREPPQLLAVGGTAVLLAGLAVFGARRLTVREAIREWEAYRPVLDGLVTMIAARLEIVGNGGERNFRRSFDADLRRWSQSALHAHRLQSVAGRFPLLVGCGVVGAALLLETSLRGKTMASALGNAALFASALPAFAGALSSAHESAKARVRFRPLAELLQAAADHKPFGGSSIPNSVESIAWITLSFRYPNGAQNALTSVDVAWPSGSVLVLAGANGSGKSTLLRLLLGVTRDYEGTIRIGDKELSETDLTAWRSSIGYLPQRPYLADRARIDASFALTSPGTSVEGIRACLERVGLWDVLVEKSAKDPLAVTTGSLSTGQRQRLALARLLASDKPVLLLDEPDANLDAAGIKLVASLVRELSSTKRIAIVAHTDELIALGDVVVTLDHGQVVKTTEVSAARAPHAGTAG